MRRPKGRIGRAVGVLAVALAGLALPGAAHAEGTPDQQQTCAEANSSEIAPNTLYAQTFTAGLTGTMDQVFVLLDSEAGDAPATLKIEGVTGNAPNGHVLDSETLPANAAATQGFPEEYNYFLPLTTPVPVQAGTEYALVVSTAGTTWSWDIARDGGFCETFAGLPPYTRGEALTSVDGTSWDPVGGDFTFETWVTEAPTVAFLDPLAGSSADGTVVNTAKNGRVVPVKVRLSQDGSAITDANAPGPVTLAVSDQGVCGAGSSADPVDAYAGGSSSSGDSFRYDATAGAWVYNLATKAMHLTSGHCYRLDVVVNGVRTGGAWAILEPVR